jgi:hypothetical protein
MHHPDRIKPLALIAGFALAVLAGCSENSTGGGTPETSTAVPPGSAIYGLNVEVSAADGVDYPAEAAMVYVFLRKPGTRMPLAVQHFPARELPRTVSFAGDGPDEAVELVVRLSPSGRVDRSPEDVEVTEALPGLRHPPQTLAVVLGSEGSARAGAAPAQSPTQAPAPVHATAIRAKVTIDGPHGFAPDTVVFVIARKSGQAMPSAVRRLSVADLPAEIELTDQDSMSFSNRLSEATSLDLFARVSTTGTASQSSADWLSEIVHVDTSQPPEVVTLTMRRPE